MKKTINYKGHKIDIEVTEIDNDLDGDIVSQTACITIVIDDKIEGNELQYNVIAKEYTIDYRGKIKLSKEAGDLIVAAIADTNYQVIIFDSSKIKASPVDPQICRKCGSYLVDCECEL